MISSKVSSDKIGADRWVLTSPVVYIDNINPALRVIASIGFYTDFLSIPAIASPFFSRTGIAAPAGVIHDALYSDQAELSAAMKARHPRGLNRKQADHMLYLASVDLGESKFRAKLMYWGVRIRGGKAWKHYRSNSIG